MPRLEEILEVEDGVVELKNKELDIREQENEDDKEIAERKLELEEEKIKSQEDIAALRLVSTETAMTWRQIIDELNFTYLVQRAISNKEEQIKEIMTLAV